MPKLSILITLSFVAILPRDIFTSAMIGNDYMLVFFAILSFYLFLKTLFALRNGNKVYLNFIVEELAMGQYLRRGFDGIIWSLLADLRR
jgi:hypothetical protein